MSDQISIKEARARLWHMGILRWKLTEIQRDLVDSYASSQFKTNVWLCSRRIGKSYALCTLAIEKCLSKPNTVVKYIAPTQKHVKNIIRPILKNIFLDCPEEILPHFRTADNIYRFQNGSEIQLAGTDSGHAETLRGGSSDLCVVDEAGFCDDLTYIIQSILIPTTTTTFGKIILSSTPPRLADHEFVKYIEEAEARGSYLKRTVYDGLNKSILTQQMLDDIINEYGGIDNPEFKREYECRIIRDSDRQVIPEFTEELISDIVCEWEKPAYFDIYVAGDLGVKDFSIFLFGYYDFRNSKIIIEDEVVLRGQEWTTEALANGIKDKESQWFINPITKDKQKPYLRVCDNSLTVLNDLQVLHGLNFIPTAKDDAFAAINNMRILIKQKRIIINPRCKALINHLKYASWNKSRTSFSRSPDYGHYDGVHALTYFCRAVQQQKNPYPASFGFGTGDEWFQLEKVKQNVNLPKETQAAFSNIFKIRSSLRRGQKL